MEQLDKMVVVRPVRDKDELIRLNTEAGWDDHSPVLPTHVFDKSGELAGYASVGQLTTINTWFHTERMKARDSIIAVSALENMTRLSGSGGILGPLSDKAPFLPVMGRLGYHNLGKANMMAKVF